MKCCWGMTIESDAAQAQGFSRASRETKRAGERAGIIWDETAPIALHWTSPVLYSPIEGKKNIFYSVYEARELVPEFQEAFDHPLTTAILTPSTFCQKIFQQHTKKPVYVVPHGFNPAIFYGKEREWEPTSRIIAPPFNGNPLSGKAIPKPLIFLYVGAINERKGVGFLDDFWKSFVNFKIQRGEAATLPLYQLVIKSRTRLDPEESASMLEGVKTGEFSLIVQEKNGFILRVNFPAIDNQTGKRGWIPGNVRWDTREISDEELAHIYRESHCFLFPTRGEGFGLTLLEAMATGLPAITTNYSGHLDFCSEETAFLVKHSLVELPNSRGLKQTMAHPDEGDFTDKFFHVISNYRRAALKGKRAMQHVHQHCTWDHVGKQLVQVLRQCGAT
jgi:glycosyltransferase involved in cell wall biosynthesis